MRLQRGHDLTEPERRSGSVPVMGSAGQNGFHDEAKAPGPGVVIGRSGASIGRVHFTATDYWPHNTCLYVTDFLGNNPRFVYYLLKTLDLAGYNSGSAQPSLNRNYIYGAQVRIPPRAEQDAIASTLDALDRRLGLLRQTNTTLEAIAQALFKSWFVDFDPVRAKAEGREPDGMEATTATLFPSTSEDDKAIAATPTGWSSSALYDLAQFINGAAYKAFEPNAERRGLPIIKIAELKAGVTPQTAFSEVDMPLKYRIDSNDILFSWSGNPDTSIDTFVWSHGAAWLNQHIFRVVPNDPHERSFVLLTLKYLKSTFAEIARDKQTTGLGHVTVADLKRLRVVKPDMPLLKEWNKLVDPLIERAFVIQQQAQSLAQLRDTLLPRLISGKLRLPDAQALIEEATP